MAGRKKQDKVLEAEAEVTPVAEAEAEAEVTPVAEAEAEVIINISGTKVVNNTRIRKGRGSVFY